MKHTLHKDLVGTVTADITDYATGNLLSDLAENFGIVCLTKCHTPEFLKESLRG